MRRQLVPHDPFSRMASSFAPQQFGVLVAGFIASFFVALLHQIFASIVRTRTSIPFDILTHRIGGRMPSKKLGIRAMD